jgi:hypothetical protein
MDWKDIDTGGNVETAYTGVAQNGCNFGGIGIGEWGESINLTTIDTMGHDNIGFIHCDAQGAEPFLFSHGLETIKRDRPVILYEDTFADQNGVFFDTVCKAHPKYKNESKFDIKEYCINHLNYKLPSSGNWGWNILLIPAR